MCTCVMLSVPWGCGLVLHIQSGHCGMSPCMMEQGCALYRKFLNYDALLCVESGICFRVLSVLCRMCACCGWVFICCRVFLDALGLVYVR